MNWQYETALPYLPAGGVLSSDDVQIAHSVWHIFSANAFPTFCEEHRLPYGLFGNHGIAFVSMAAN